ncbi:MAG: hypothetical protein WA816_05710 [Bacteroidales bacterium]
MKKALFSILAFLGFLFPLLAQVDHDFNTNDREPLISTTLTADQVPAAVIKAAQTQFDLSNSATWSKFPYALKEYGWVYDVGASDIMLNRYEVKMKTTKGDDFWAVYTAKGELVESRETANNVPIPSNVLEALSKSQYKDWQIVGDREIIRFYHDHNNSSVEQHFRLTVEKDNVKRSISFNFQATN